MLALALYRALDLALDIELALDLALDLELGLDDALDLDLELALDLILTEICQWIEHKHNVLTAFP